MGYIEFARIDNDGVEWVNLENATKDELLDLEIALFQEKALWYLSHWNSPKCPILDLIFLTENAKIK